MIKIEFKEASLDSELDIAKFGFYSPLVIRQTRDWISKNRIDISEIISITQYTPTQDPYLDRSFILQQLGISKEQDEEMQHKYK